MNYGHTFLLAALEEYEDSVYWYRKRSASAAENFVKSIEKAIEIICADPLTFKSLYQNYHELTLLKYPFTIVYKIEEPLRRVHIVAIYHQNRDPKYKYR